MTDEEITRRLAEIEGHKPTGDDYSHNFGLWCEGGNPYFGDGRGELWPFNPLMFDQQCMALIKKHRISTLDDYSEQNASVDCWFVTCPTLDGDWSEAAHESLNHAVCLAIIEAHNAPD